MAEFDLGNVVRISATFLSGGSAIDPTTVKFEFKKPGSSVVTYEYGIDQEIVKDSTGNYHVDLDLDTSGIWKLRWYSEGQTGKAAKPAEFYVKPDPVS